MPGQECRRRVLPIFCSFLFASPTWSVHKTKIYFIISSHKWLSVFNLTLKIFFLISQVPFFLKSRTLTFLFLLRSLLSENGFLYSLHLHLHIPLLTKRPFFFTLHVNVPLFLPHSFPFCEGLHCWLILRGSFLKMLPADITEYCNLWILLKQ